jgi:hypothetical protein
MGKKDRGKHPISRYEDRGAAKTPRSSFGNENPKTPRGHVPDYSGTLPLWAFRIVDLGGPWCWTNMDGSVLGEVLERLKQFESMTWLEIERGTGSHFVEDHSKLCKQARDRLVEIEQDDTETLFSLRLAGRRRIWGIRDRGVLRFLWWDPEHEVYPSEKKHT